MNVISQPWVERARTNLTGVFEGVRNMAFMFDVTDPAVFSGLEGIAATKNGKCKAILDHPLDLQLQLSGLHKRFDMGFEDDFVYALKPYTGIGLFASAFGCKTEFPDVGEPVTHPAIRSISQVAELQVDIAKVDLIQLALDKIDCFLDAVGDDIPVGYPDLQSPINVASIVCDYSELVLAMHTNPQAVHRLLGMITDVMEEVLELFDARLLDYPPSTNWWMPRGVFFSDDLMAVIGPDCYEEFALPYANRFARKYGGLFLHSCGNPLSCVDTVKKYDNFMGLDFWEVTIEQFHQAGGDYICSCPVVTDPWHNLDRRETRAEPEQAITDALADLKCLTQHAQTPVLFLGICPHPDHAQEYHSTLARIADEVNTRE